MGTRLRPRYLKRGQSRLIQVLDRNALSILGSGSPPGWAEVPLSSPAIKIGAKWIVEGPIAGGAGIPP